MVNFYPDFVNCSPNASLSQVAGMMIVVIVLVGTVLLCEDHIDHIKKMAGVEHVGIGSDFNGIESYVA